MIVLWNPNFDHRLPENSSTRFTPDTQSGHTSRAIRYRLPIPAKYSPTTPTIFQSPA